MQDFFSDVVLSESQINLCKAFDGRLTGEGFLELRSTSDYPRCMAHNRQTMKTRYIELFPSTKADMETSLVAAARHPRSAQSDRRQHPHRFMVVRCVVDLQ